MSKKDSNCSLCGSKPDKETPAVLAIGSYGKPRCLCSECEGELDTATLGRDYGEIVKAIDSLAAKTARYGKDDALTLATMKELLESAAKRSAAIKDGSYDFSLDEAESDEGFDEIPEELLETEEDKALDEKEAAFNKKFDKVLNWLWLAVFLGIAVAVILKFFVFK